MRKLYSSSSRRAASTISRIYQDDRPALLLQCARAVRHPRFHHNTNLVSARFSLHSIADMHGGSSGISSSSNNNNNNNNAMDTRKYEGWEPQQLIARINALEQELHDARRSISGHNRETPQEVENGRSEKEDEEASSPSTKPPRENTPTQPITTTSSNTITTANDDLDNESTQYMSWKKKDKRAPRPFDPTLYTTRRIALKFAYLGAAYNGFEHHVNNATPLPTVEEELYKALVKCRLVNPRGHADKGGDSHAFPRGRVPAGHEIDWERFGYSKCGRTDRGVSAFGQVVGVTVRSNRRNVDRVAEGTGVVMVTDEGEVDVDVRDGMEVEARVDSDAMANGERPVLSLPRSSRPFDPIRDELPYIQLLNRVLPEDIRVLAWCPNPPPEFDARFSCLQRQYKYFFTQPAFEPVPGLLGMRPTAGEDGAALRTGWLDIEAMREAAEHMVGLHDFRNFCKVDPAKQVSNFMRRVTYAGVEEVTRSEVPRFVREESLHPGPSADARGIDGEPKLYAFVVHGSGFLWHQVRCLVAILFLIGQGLESAGIVKELLDVEKNPRKPKYEMASEKPLVLWDCIFPKEVEWIHVGDIVEKERRPEGTKWGPSGLVNDVWKTWRARKIDEALASCLLDVVAAKGKAADNGEELPMAKSGKKTRVFDGDDTPNVTRIYRSVMSISRRDPIELINSRYAERKGWDLSLRARKAATADPDE